MKNSPLKTLVFVLSVISVFSAAGCKDDEPAIIPVDSVSISKTTITLVEGDSETLSVTVSPSTATNKSVSWSSSRPDVATVDEDGKVTAVKAGAASITVITTDGSKTAKCDVTVEPRPIPVAGISLDKSSLELVEDEEASLIATIAPSDASNKTFTWSSSNTQIATVDDSGKVTAVAPGTATITATTADGGKTAACAVSVEAKPIPVSKGAYKHVIIIGVDGGGAFFKNTSTPRMDAIFKNGAVSYRTKTSYPTISAQCWGSMLHSVLPEFHRLTNGTVGSKPFKPDSPFPSIFRLVKEAFPNANMASFCNWNPINIGIIEDNLGVVKGTGSDPEVADKVVNYIQGNDPTLVFVQFDSVDGAGHGSGYGSARHLSAITAVDALIGNIYDAVKRKGILDDTLFLVSADHGGTPEGSHGGDTDAERYVFLGVAGKTVVEGGQIQEPEVRDIAAISAYAFGLDFPETWTGIVPGGLFQGVEAMERHEMKPEEIPVSENRKHQTEPTPALDNVKSLLEGHNVIAYFPLDGDGKDALGKVETVSTGKLYYSDAYYGKGADMSDGYITLKDVAVGTNSFSVALWIKTNGVPSDPCIISNKNWNSGGNVGFVLSIRSDEDIKFNAGNNGDRMDAGAGLPLDYKNGWMHVILVVDRDKNKIRLFYDFASELDYDIPESLRNVSFDALDLNIGQDGTGHYGAHLAAQLDEFIITADALSDEDIAKLKAYYVK
ncbi:MAG: Ig-like domain-containing protein [Bacteroidales bacterium]|nr:Ig-like domain-containing protein [Bacteroidales bacterium]